MLIVLYFDEGNRQRGSTILQVDSNVVGGQTTTSSGLLAPLGKGEEKVKDTARRLALTINVQQQCRDQLSWRMFYFFTLPEL